MVNTADVTPNVPLGWCLDGHHAAVPGKPGHCPYWVTSGRQTLHCSCKCHRGEKVTKPE